MEFEEDFFALTVLCLLKETKEEWMIKAHKQAQLMYSCILISIVVFTMLTCMVYELYLEAMEEEAELTDKFNVFWIKVPCSVALHFVLYPEVGKGMAVMKFANQ